MSGRPTDDELREMLEARASQASPDADREAMAGLRAAMRGTPDARGAFAVLPVSTSARGGRLPGIIVASGLVAVILVAVLGGQLSAPKEASSAGVVDTHVPESIPTLGVSGPDQAAVFSADALPESWNGAHFEGALTDQDIVGQVVVLTGTLTTSLCNAGGSCVTDIDGIAGVPVVFPYLLQAPDLVGPGTRTAIRARADGGVDYLGQLNANPVQPLTVEGLLSEDSTPGRGLFVGGWLAQRPADVGTQPCQVSAPSAVRLSPVGSWVDAHEHRARCRRFRSCRELDRRDPERRLQARLSAGHGRVDVPRQLHWRRLGGRRDRRCHPARVASAVSVSVVDRATGDHPARPGRAVHGRRAPHAARGRLARRAPRRHRWADRAGWPGLRPPSRLPHPDDQRSRRRPDRHGHGGTRGAPARDPAPGPARVRGARQRPSLPRTAAGGRRPSDHRQPAARHADPVLDRPVVTRSTS